MKAKHTCWTSCSLLAQQRSRSIWQVRGIHNRTIQAWASPLLSIEIAVFESVIHPKIKRASEGREWQKGFGRWHGSAYDQSNAVEE